MANVNDDPNGTVAITGKATQGQTLTASNTLADIDGLGDVSYQWLSDDVVITDATDSTYVLTQDDVGTFISVTASYTDGGGTHESVTSGVTDVVVKGSVPLYSSNNALLTTKMIHYQDSTGTDNTLPLKDFSPTNTRLLSAQLDETTSGAVDISDVISQLRYIAGLSELTGLKKAAADNDANGSVEISDVIRG